MTWNAEQQREKIEDDLIRKVDVKPYTQPQGPLRVSIFEILYYKYKILGLTPNWLKMSDKGGYDTS